VTRKTHGKFGENSVEVIASDTAGNESAPATVTIFIPWMSVPGRSVVGGVYLDTFRVAAGRRPEPEKSVAVWNLIRLSRRACLFARRGSGIR
jgi:hypothetical protein